MPTFKDKVSFPNVSVSRATEKALKCDIDGNEVWIPTSQIDDDSEVFEEGGSGTLIVSEWIAKEKGLI